MTVGLDAAQRAVTAYAKDGTGSSTRRGVCVCVTPNWAVLHRDAMEGLGWLEVPHELSLVERQRWRLDTDRKTPNFMPNRA